ncbi:transcription antitermination factor NusB [Desulfoplanes formicivorans]|uniref:NusB/RsmB/TIM44 n=1 Tax=Desulfoplanes formicivorans TaxID=1592317 RepID=A0A194AH72_9BACT|nr:transcription antitermination factor NusB [Desulfoplanes formicivorans]GAU08436.1 NusB/RsmB/TIM44 [Desulfoplanes formicivorans]
MKSFSSDSLPLARQVALQAIYRCLYKHQDLQFALDQALDTPRLSHRDKGLATELAYGYVRNKTRSDFLVTFFLRSPDKLPRVFMLVLGMAAYELAFLDRIPAYATVDWAVQGIKLSWGKRLAGVANAVLRRIGDLGPAVHEPDWYRQDDPDTVTFLTRYYSCPEWIVRLWLESYGMDTACEVLEGSIARPALGLRCGPDMDPESLALEVQDLLLARCGRSLALQQSFDHLDELLRQGQVSRQSYAAQMALSALEPLSWPTPIWDACCGRGGKSMALLEQGCFPVWASDLHTGRLAGMQQECRRTGRRIPLFRASAKETPPFRTPPGTILLDVPCSGLGVLARRPDSKWKRTPRDVSALMATQKAILENAWNVLPTGGVIAYITCTLNPAENQDQIARLCKRHRNATIVREYATKSREGLGEFFYAVTVRKA